MPERRDVNLITFPPPGEPLPQLTLLSTGDKSHRVPYKANNRSAASCPLCQTPEAKVCEELPVRDIDHEYRRQLGVPVQSEFPAGLASLHLCHCQVCGLEFYDPLLAGSPGFYAALSQSSGYYSPMRWEFGETSRIISANARVVDVGCGDGRFLRTLTTQASLGLELNPEAIRRARASGLTVSDQPVSTLPAEHFDAVTIFQVLEHVTNPRELLDELVRIMRREGQLFVAVPNNDGYVGRAIQEPLNLAPHHPLRWTRPALEFIPNLLPLKLKWVKTEPVGPDHLFSYRRERVTSFFAGSTRPRPPLIRRNPWTIFIRKAANLTVMASMRISSSLPSPSIPGHSYLALFTKV